MHKYVERYITLLLVTVHTCTFYHFGIVHTIGVELFMNSHSYLCAKYFFSYFFFLIIHTEYEIDSANILHIIQDFFCKLDMKPHIHLVEITILSLYLVIVRPTEIINRTDKNWAQF
jgi:hypothetical protein